MGEPGCRRFDWREWLEISLQVTSGEFGIFPEMDLLIWLRSYSLAKKILVLRPEGPRQRSGLRIAARAFSSREIVPSERELDPIFDLMAKLGFPEKAPRVKGIGDPELPWWSHLFLDVLAGNHGHRLILNGPGISGEDSGLFLEFLRKLLEVSGAFDDGLWHLITRERS